MLRSKDPSQRGTTRERPVLLELLWMMLLGILLLLGAGSGMCALMGLTVIGKGGLVFVVIGGSVATVSFLGFVALVRRFFERPSGGPDERPR